MAYFDEETDAVIRAQWQALAGPVRNSIHDQEHKTAVRNAVSQYLLSKEDTVALEDEVLMVLLGLQTKEEFAEYLPTIEGLSPNDAAAVMTHIDEHLFALLSPYLNASSAAEPGSETPAHTHPLNSGGSTSPLEQFVIKDDAIRERFEKLPETVRQAILAENVAQAFSNVVRNNDLNQEQFITLGTLAVQVMVGLATTKDFRSRATEQHLVDEAHLKELVAEVEQNMFKPVRDAIVHTLDKRK
jgi:hypothetical protein